MTSRQESAERTRQQLIDAGLRLAERIGLAQMSVNLVVAEAGVSKGTFFHHFGDRAGYLRALHQEFHDQLLAQAVDVASEHPPGESRLWQTTLTYLNGCLARRGVRALLLEARAEPVIAAEIRSRNDTMARLCEPDFGAMGRPHPLASAKLWVGLVAEAALIEFDAGGPQPDLRDALRQYLR